MLFGKAFGPPDRNADIDEIVNRNLQDQFRPFILTEQASSQQVKSVGSHAASWGPALRSMEPETFTVLHSWYNEKGNHDLALLCLDIAISCRMASSKIFSFRSASLRKLGRLREAYNSASFALELDSTNVDAHYNLAKILWELGKTTEAWDHAQIALTNGHGVYDARIKSVFPKLAGK